MTKKRLDQLMVEKKLVRSRSQAQAFIKQGVVSVNQVMATKSGALFEEGALINIKASTGYVSRGAYKLIKALDAFSINPSAMVCADIGASSGGFTQVLLERGASLVYAIDVGKDQLSQSLRNDPRVVCFEQLHVLEAKLPRKVDLCVVDLSFISLTKVMGAIFDFLVDDGKALVLIKPQFEGCPQDLNSKGLIQNAHRRQEIVSQLIKRLAEQKFFVVHGPIESPIKGKKGNTEYLALFSKEKN